MYGADEGKLDLAYKYPFSSEAKEIVRSSGAGLEQGMLKAGRIRIEEALNAGSIEYKEIGMSDLKRIHVMSYVYARMLVSALNNRGALIAYVTAEARRSGDALVEDTEENIMLIAKELGVGLDAKGGEFSLCFEDYLSLSPKTPDFSLVHQEMKDGIVHIQKYKAARLLESAIRKEIRKNLPIPVKELPKEAVQYAKTIKVPMQKAEVVIDNARYDWIARVLATPIADVRHRTVNLILAPYLVNVKNMEVDEAAKVITDYIERCRAIDPNTKINDSYIRYQCKYAKDKGSKPLSYERAKDLLKDVVAFN